jgi:hypothetical protein
VQRKLILEDWLEFYSLFFLGMKVTKLFGGRKRKDLGKESFFFPYLVEAAEQCSAQPTSNNSSRRR